MISKAILVLIMTGLFLLAIPHTSAFSAHQKVTPYGDYCSRMSHYGMHESMMDLRDAEKALKKCYGAKGLDIEVAAKEGRFMKVYLRDRHGVVDIIIFDRLTGRVRSIY